MNKAVDIKTIAQRLRRGEQFTLVFTMVLVVILMTILNGSRFISAPNLAAMAYQLPMIGFLAIGMMVSELSGGINLSIVANANFNGIVIAMVLTTLTKGHMAEANGFFIIIAVLAGLVSCILVGAFNGFLVTKLNIPAILVTLGTMTLLQGISVVLTRGYTVSGFPKALIFLGNGSLGGIPFSIIIFIAVVVISHFILNRSSYGTKLYMVGANPKACRFSNIQVDRIIVLEYIFSACFSFFTSLVMIGQMNSVKANYADSYVLVAVLASFLGGVNPNGGFGKLSGMVLAAVILQLISTGLNLLRVDPFMITAMWGAIIIIILAVKEAASLIAKKTKGSKETA
ncbi:ABC transporter permease [Spirochaetia bacterium]|nr:ABC transporter permease [Spirochaetia bacterium]